MDGNIRKCMEISDVKIVNNGTIDDLSKEVESVLNIFKYSNV